MSSILGDSTAPNRQPRSPFKPSAKPTSRKSLSALQGEPTNGRTMMMDVAVQAKTVEEGGEKRKRAYSVGGVQGQGKNQLSPRSQARRMAVSSFPGYREGLADKWGRLETPEINLEDSECSFCLFTCTINGSSVGIITHTSASITVPPATARTYD
jgi:hypothetical protein